MWEGNEFYFDFDARKRIEQAMEKKGKGFGWVSVVFCWGWEVDADCQTILVEGVTDQGFFRCR